MNNNEAKTQRIGEICKKTQMATTYNKGLVVNMAPVSKEIGVIMQRVYCQGNAAVFETRVPLTGDYEDLWAFSGSIFKVNKSLLFGAYDLDMDENTIYFRSTIYSRSVEDIRPREVKFHMKLGFNMAMKMVKDMANETDGEDVPAAPGPSSVENMYG